MTPTEVKAFIIAKRYFIGWEIGMFLKVIYPKILPRRPKRGGASVPLPGGCEVCRTKRGEWFLISHTPSDIDDICEELSKMKSLGLDTGICLQNASCPDDPVVIAPGVYRGDIPLVDDY
jgi:hypothetical protein